MKQNRRCKVMIRRLLLIGMKPDLHLTRIRIIAINARCQMEVLFHEKNQIKKKSFTLLCGISANYESVRPVFILQNFCRGFKKKDFLEQKITEDITRYKTNRFTVYINKKSNWMNSTIWEDILKLTNEKNKRRNESSLIIVHSRFLQKMIYVFTFHILYSIFSLQ